MSEDTPVGTTGFMRWLADRYRDAGNVPDADTIEHFGRLARTAGLDADDFDLLAEYIDTSPDEITAAYKRDNNQWAAAQAVMDQGGLTGLDEHLDMMRRGHHVPEEA